MADTKNEIFREIIQRSLMLRIGQQSVVIIKKRVADGIFLEGSSDGASQYSTKPFAMPTGAIKPRSLMLDIIKGKKGDDTQLFKSNHGKLWVVITKGYKWLREQAGKPSGKVDMRWTSELMRSLTVLNINAQAGEITIGHRGKRNEDLAYWHNVAGAGRSKKIRKWLLLTNAELEKLGNENF
jgi:hypothetical protein